MKVIAGFISMLSLFLLSCGTGPVENASNPKPITGTWQLVSGTLLEKGDTTHTD